MCSGGTKDSQRGGEFGVFGRKLFHMTSKLGQEGNENMTLMTVKG